MRTDRVTVIDMQVPTARCCMCGKWDVSKWGIPFDMATGLAASNESQCDWAAKPACESCWKRHETGAFVGEDSRY